MVYAKNFKNSIEGKHCTAFPTKPGSRAIVFSMVYPLTRNSGMEFLKVYEQIANKKQATTFEWNNCAAFPTKVTYVSNKTGTRSTTVARV